MPIDSESLPRNCFESGIAASEMSPIGSVNNGV